jgi:GDP-fucose transporter C1
VPISQETSALTHNISGTAKAAVQTVLALMWYRNPFTLASGVGNALVLGGSAAYAAVKTSAMAAPAPPATAGVKPTPK